MSRRVGRNGQQGPPFRRPRPIGARSLRAAASRDGRRPGKRDAGGPGRDAGGAGGREAGSGGGRSDPFAPALGDVDRTVAWMRETLGQSDDFVVRGFTVFGRFGAAMFFFSDLVDPAVVNEDILHPLMRRPPRRLEGEVFPEDLAWILTRETIYHCETRLEPKPDKVVEAVLRGQTAIVVEGLGGALLADTRTIDRRSVDQPSTEQVIRGARDGFIEQIRTNLALLRYRLQTPDFRVKVTRLGRLAKTEAAVCYIESVANPDLVKEVQTRLSAIAIDAVEPAGYVEQLIEDHHLSPFPQIQSTERPDKAVAALLEGRVVILLDGTPFALIVPAVFSQFLQTIDDYSERFLMANLVRFVRLLALVFSLIFPSLYVSLISYNPELIPTRFAVAVAGGRAGVPFPAVIEVLLMEVSMEVLREATIRMPQQVGGALSIVGALVIGQAAVAAGFASPVTVVVVALTTIGSFATPAYNVAVALRMLRFPLMILAGMFGLFGVMVGLIAISNHLLSLRSFGVPYLSPVVPIDRQGIKDTFMRGPFWTLIKRPAYLRPRQPARVGRRMLEALKKPKGAPLRPFQFEQGEGGGHGAPRPDHGGSSDGGPR
ncbi:MAG: spore germination protein [Alicyclobacillaceae bacterium]|nr:spore germination protein [Alicyclobacillaceae bacterium]